MKLKVTLDEIIISLDKDLDKLLEQFAYDELSETNRRTASELARGKNVEGGSMKDYSASYKKQIKSGKVRGKENPELTNLTQTGQLQGSRNVTRIKDGAELSIEGTRNTQIASKVIDKGFDKWFEFGTKDLTRIGKALEKLLEKGLIDSFKIRRK